MSIVTNQDIENFLQDFSQKMKVFDIVFERRDKNLQALYELDITPSQRIEYIQKLKLEHYLSGPNKDINDSQKPDYWEFAIKVKDKPVYIKINMGLPNKHVICISFHIAERKIINPFESKKKKR